ncbi:PilZ domain-containing protein [Dasania sp. GY-MA-18]|uniref:PilZ domain-containing protein n=1 Tax=Dasania phycosphaerae TaxID=2950436 RepID=A0A9J6RIX5_9GAMM|nr:MULTISPECIES: PilZ domain-containing protein [Dasania]MCR8921902.1 PilZ domain-containing protein [Dasania sp. GY-MA-18]MCZ0864330.1 PilZ domain-containing protein [Dasania phycosphaerae]MCZ0868058.1 PilZ domain-containing protein [Dasania phycosphaerae]
MDKSSPSNGNPFDIGDMRNYFRVSSEVKVRTVVCSKQQVDKDLWPQALAKSPALQLVETLRNTEHEAAPLLRSIGEQNRAIEQYLRNINKRIELIANHLNNHDEQAHDSQEQQVLISEGGIEFSIESLSKIKLHDYLALELVLNLSQLALSLFGKVINVREKNNRYLIGVEFVALKELDRQQLAKHVIQQQLVDKRDAKSES